jgi:hypothetical protein
VRRCYPRRDLFIMSSRISFYAQMTRLSPANLTMVLDFMKYEYNQTRTVLPLEPSLCH